MLEIYGGCKVGDPGNTHLVNGSIFMNVTNIRVKKIVVLDDAESSEPGSLAVKDNIFMNLVESSIEEVVGAEEIIM